MMTPLEFFKYVAVVGAVIAGIIIVGTLSGGTPCL